MLLQDQYIVNPSPVYAKQGDRPEDSRIRQMCAPVPAEHIMRLPDMDKALQRIVISQGTAFLEGLADEFCGGMQDHPQLVACGPDFFLHIIFPDTVHAVRIPQVFPVQVYIGNRVQAVKMQKHPV